MLNVNNSTGVFQSSSASLLDKKGVEQINATKEVTKSRADTIKDQIKNGDYKIDINSTTEKMALNLLGE